MKKLSFFVLVIAMTFQSAQGAILDQAQEQRSGYFTLSGGGLYAQTFTCGTSGYLDSVDLHVADVGTTLYPTIMSIVATNSDVPDGTTLGEVSFEVFTNGWHSVDFVSQSILLTEGTMYGIVVSNDTHFEATAPPIAISSKSSSNPYVNGALWDAVSGDWEYIFFDPAGTADLAFRTYMVPEPTTILLLGLGTMMLRKKRKQ